MKKPSKRQDLPQAARPLGQLELGGAVGGAMMAYAVTNPVPSLVPGVVKPLG